MANKYLTDILGKFKPLQVVDSTARKALVGLPNGAIVQEVGAVAVTTITVNLDDVGGNTKTTSQTNFALYYMNNNATVGSTNLVFGGNVTYSNGSTASQIATAIANYYNLSFSGVLLVVASGNVVTITRKYIGTVNASVLTANSHTGFLSFNDTVLGAPLGNAYTVSNNTQLNSDNGWTLVDALRNASVPFNAAILPGQAFINNIIGLLTLTGPYISLPSNFPPVTSVDIQFLANLVGEINNVYGSSNLTVNLSNQALDSNTVNGILSYFANSGIYGGYLNLSGGTNAAPPYSAGFDLNFKFTFTGIPADGGTIYDGSTTYNFSSTGNGLIDTSDSPDPITLAQRVADNSGAFGTSFGSVYADGTGSVYFACSSAYLQYIGNPDCNATNVTLTITQAGQPPIDNPDIDSLNNNAWAVSINFS